MSGDCVDAVISRLVSRRLLQANVAVGEGGGGGPESKHFGVKLSPPSEASAVCRCRLPDLFSVKAPFSL